MLIFNDFNVLNQRTPYTPHSPFKLASDILDNMPFKTIGSKLNGIISGVTSGFGTDLSSSMKGSFTGEEFESMLNTVQDSVGSVFTSLSEKSQIILFSFCFKISLQILSISEVILYDLLKLQNINLSSGKLKSCLVILFSDIIFLSSFGW